MAEPTDVQLSNDIAALSRNNPSLALVLNHFNGFGGVALTDEQLRNHINEAARRDPSLHRILSHHAGFLELSDAQILNDVVDAGRRVPSLQQALEHIESEPVRVSRIYRTDTAARLKAIASFQAGNRLGQWALDTGGSTSSANTGPGTNSPNPGAYMYSETSTSSRVDEINANSSLTFDMTKFGTAVGRRLRLQFCAQGHFSDANEGIRMRFKNAAADAWATLEQHPGWPYSNSREEGDTISPYNDGDDVECVRDGGWIDWWVDIPDKVVALQYRTHVVSGSLYTHDVALWEVEFSWLEEA